jgi:hypothetical protein
MLDAVKFFRFNLAPLAPYWHAQENRRLGNNSILLSRIHPIYDILLGFESIEVVGLKIITAIRKNFCHTINLIYALVPGLHWPM